ncbi:hypothetical protein F511_33236 [Dorcoceras hygrometricum]|uniref:Uncharacterized protein n=1 Tax=Dorcoceras hygrometricum TaxID=472368 RepID=A0A2Z7BT51_9LAMI|nr:hypothetical protein F511_33236 [Dorcoceras hygrometricum]
MCKCRSHGTFPLFGLQSSHLNICYYHQDPHRRPLRPGSRPGFCGDRRALLLIGAWPLTRQPGRGRCAPDASNATTTKIHTDGRSSRARALVFTATATPPYSSGPGPCPDGRSFAPIPKSDERFARQYRCGPPPEFPLASPRSGIVHHLSGPDSRIPLVRTSSESTVRRPGKAPEGAVPSPSPGRHAVTRSRRASSSSSSPTADGFGTGTPVPSPQSPSFSRGYGSILPTSLAYIVPSTRGCSPWRPDAVMSTTGRGRHSVLRIFKGRRGRTGHHATCGALPAAGPYLRLSRFQGGQAVKQKR